MLKNILAIETSAAVCSVALSTERAFFDQFELAQREQSQLLLPMINKILEEANISLTDLSAIAVAIGPGSFTGIRLGLSVVQGFTIGTHIPVIAISSLQAIAQGIFEEFGEPQVLVCVNAYMDEVFFAIYCVDAEGIMQLEGEELLSLPEELLLPPNFTECVGAGNGWAVHAERLPSAPKKIYTEYLPRARNLVKLAQALQNQAKPIDEISAIYLRNANAWRSKNQ